MDEESKTFFRGNGDYRGPLKAEFTSRGIDFIESTAHHSGIGPDSFILGSGLETDLGAAFVAAMKKLGTERLYIMRDFYLQISQAKKKKKAKKK